MSSSCQYGVPEWSGDFWMQDLPQLDCLPSESLQPTRISAFEPEAKVNSDSLLPTCGCTRFPVAHELAR